MEILTVKDQQKSYHEEYVPHLFKERAALTPHKHTQQLADIVTEYMNPLGISDEQRHQLTELAAGAPVVIGGQQAGLFVSPLYTIHKIISIIVLAKEQSEQLAQTIVPVFWIAGEDHDFSEVNHAYLYDGTHVKLNKVKVATKRQVETSVSDFVLTDDEKLETIRSFIKELDETERTEAIYNKLAELPNGWTDQFKQLIHELFKQTGLLLIDSHYQPFRQLEKETFKYLLKNHQAINEAFLTGQQKSVDSGQQKMIETSSNVHLFMTYEEQRQLLNFADGRFTLNKSAVTFTGDELLNLLEAEPELFSNNVVTRPVMQEMMFNTLCFIGGPSEIKYWNELTDIFSYMKRSMPILVPRMRITYLTPRIQKLIGRYELQLEDILTTGMKPLEQQFLKNEENQQLLEGIQNLEQLIDLKFNELSELAESKQVTAIVNSNLEHHRKQVEYLKRAYHREIKIKNDIVLRHFKEIELNLNPRNGLQERTWHPIQLINDTDFCIFNDIIEQLMYTKNQVVIAL